MLGSTCDKVQENINRVEIYQKIIKPEVVCMPCKNPNSIQKRRRFVMIGKS